MMQYFNSVTGVSIETDCIISGDNWEECDQDAAPPKKEKKPPAEKADEK
ncbi:MAG: hypothetical protein RSC36_05375 [Ruthenibacterium sp.]